MLSKNQEVTVTKYKLGKTRPFSYKGRVLEQTAEKVTIEAFFNINDKPFHGVVFRRGDRFVETYYSKRWYNIFEIHDVDTDLLKCWYCNVAEPAVFEPEDIWFIDMELDLLVYPDGSFLVLDEDELEAAELPENVKKQALEGLKQLKELEFSEWKIQE